MLSDRAVTFIAVTITVVWAALSVGDALSTSYEVPDAINGIMGLLAGALFGERAVRARTKSKRDG